MPWLSVLNSILNAGGAGYTFLLFRARVTHTLVLPWALLGQVLIWAVPVGIAGSFIAVSLHEAGHAIAGWRVGMKPKAIRIGIGPVLADFAVGPIRFQIHAVPSTGRTTYPHAPAITTHQRRLVVLSGPAMHVLLIALGLPLLFGRPMYAVAGAGLIAINVDLLRNNLRVRRPRCGERQGNDGWQLQQLRLGGVELLRRHELQANARAVLRGEPGQAIEMLEFQLTTCSGMDDPRHTPLQLHLAHQYGRAGRFEDAARTYADVLSRTAPDHESAPLMRACWADATLSHAVINGVDPGPDILQSCQEALDAVGDVRGTTHTRAVLALASGHLSTAVELGQASLTADKPEAEERHVIAATIGLALARLGDLPAARAWLADVPSATPFAATALAAAAGN